MFRWFRKPPAGPSPDALYRRIVEQARRPAFYQELGVADTPDGRFDMLCVHAWLVMRRLRGEGDVATEFSQTLFDLMFQDMDRNLRELGVGDLAVGKRIKGMAQGFYGRIQAYDAALDADDMPALCQALRRNVYRAMTPDEAQVAALARYVDGEQRSLAGQTATALMAGDVAFNTPPPMEPVSEA